MKNQQPKHYMLDTPISSLSRISPDHALGLHRLHIETVHDLLRHLPTRYADMREITDTDRLVAGKAITVYGIMEKVTVKRSFKGHVPMTEARIVDAAGALRCLWFNQAYIGKMYPDGTKVKLSGIVQEDSRGFLLSNPTIEKVSILPESQDSLFALSAHDNNDASFLTPIYPETKGVSSLYLYTLIKKAIAGGVLDDVHDPIPPHILAKLHLPELREALLYIHFPKNENLTIAARKRFAFEEIFFMQIKQYREKVEAKHSLAHPITISQDSLDTFIASFPFTPTDAQTEAITSILEDLKRQDPMGRLLEGDVGSGKTFVAATVAYATLHNRVGKSGPRLQVAYMAPTEILAKQHFESFIHYFKGTGIEIGLLTGSGCKKFPSKTDDTDSVDISRTQLIKWLADGRVSVVIGTHALIQKSVNFANLALIIIDEQHRFGVKQRAKLARKTNADIDADTADATHTHSDDFLYKELSYTLRGICFMLKKQLGVGHKEIVYQNAFEIELQKNNIAYTREKKLPVIYEGKTIGIYQPDFIIDDKIIIEFKSIKFLGAVEKKQLFTYLQGSSYTLGFLINFGGADVEIERVVYDTARTGLRSLPPSAKSAQKVPHLLSMTATPIPRTLALTLFGDLDITVIDTLPKNRKKIITEIVPNTKRQEIYEKIREELVAGRQIYVICPRIDEQDEEEKQKRLLKSVHEEAKHLADVIFPEFIVDIIHSKMKKEEKEEAMEDFLNKKSDILVATSVVEVGVNIPNATVIIIEHADRFGLAQLHQLRGRVGRAEHQSYCYLFTEIYGESTRTRLKALVSAKNGFELAEKDMLARGIGMLMDGKQWGISDLAMEAIKNPKLVEIARFEARELVDNDPTLENYPDLQQLIKDRENVHME
jgi:ATP-dependent DNA helicase RecG